MANITLRYTATKSGYHQFTSPDVRGIVYFSKAAFTGIPGDITVELDGLAAPAAPKVPADPAKLQAAADKAQKQAEKQAARAAALQAQLAKLVPAPAAETPAETPAEPVAETPAEPEPVAEPVKGRKGRK